MHTHSIKLACIILAAAASVGCGKKSEDTAAEATEKKATGGYAPKLTAEHMPQGMESLALGQADEAAVAAALGTVERHADTSLGGDGIVNLNGAPAVKLKGADRQAWLAKQEGDALALVRLEVAEPGICDRLWGKLGDDDVAKICPGSNIVTGKVKGGWLLCGGTPDGKQGVRIECRDDRVQYSVRTK